jgi:type VI secretion system protein ImpF
LAKGRSEIPIRQSLIDRLSDLEPWPETRKDSIRLLRDSLKRDVEWLLNTRKPAFLDPARFPSLASSVLCFGLPDPHTFDYSLGKAPSALARAIEECLLKFEPRISRPRVTFVPEIASDRSLRFHVDGVLRYEDLEEEIKLDTVLELISGEYEVV